MIEVVIFKTYNMYCESAQDITGEFLRYDCAVIKISDNLKFARLTLKLETLRFLLTLQLREYNKSPRYTSLGLYYSIYVQRYF